jgi:hypothetical protein
MTDKIISLTSNIEQFKKFITVIKELSLINSTIIIILNDINIIFYSFVGKDINDIHAFKTVTLNTNDIFYKKRTIDKNISIVIKDGKKFNRNAQNFIDLNNDIKLKISFDESDMNANYIHLINDILKIKEICGDPLMMSKEITKDDIDYLTNKKKSLFNFKLNKENFKKIKRLSTIDIINDILSIKVYNNDVFIGDNKWDLKIDNINYDNIIVSFPKKYFNSITFDDDSIVYLFENYILVSDNISDLMIVLETTV